MLSGEHTHEGMEMQYRERYSRKAPVSGPSHPDASSTNGTNRVGSSIATPKRGRYFVFFSRTRCSNSKQLTEQEGSWPPALRERLGGWAVRGTGNRLEGSEAVGVVGDRRVVRLRPSTIKREPST